MNSIRLTPPDDDYHLIESLIGQACEEFIVGKSGRFKNLFDVMFEEVKENLYIYLERN